MRTTLTIADDVLAAAKSIARSRGQTVGYIISELARHSLWMPGSKESRDGVPLLPVNSPGAAVTLELVNALGNELS